LVRAAKREAVRNADIIIVFYVGLLVF
jgi:hypothetical protein